MVKEKWYSDFKKTKIRFFFLKDILLCEGSVFAVRLHSSNFTSDSKIN